MTRQGRKYYQFPVTGCVWSKSEILATLRENYHHLHVKLSTYDHAELSVLLARLQAGLPTYHTENIPLLKRRFPEGQEFPVYDAERERCHHYRWRLITMLDEKTPEYSFERFLDLPPELREKVYGYAFRYSDNAYHLQQPAVSRVCHILRTESLPIFYKMNRFGITIERYPNRYHPMRIQIEQRLVDMWPTYIRAEHVAMMRHFEVNLLNKDRRTTVRVKIDLPSLSGLVPLKIKVWSITPEKNTKHWEAYQAQVEGAMRPSIEQLLEGRVATKSSESYDGPGRVE
ncbi:hypothetical protein LTR97_004430 [Elasticomyces elasticus]|uniref:Uncharacterized protein n=1 Tax=Elasticomyces elasticus TaxID=574655 RepID=A0AAN7WDG3_9PEZI|nr:hypothetical protein LTR97_004430 [Elasticomyces elasticus]